MYSKPNILRSVTPIFLALLLFGCNSTDSSLGVEQADGSATNAPTPAASNQTTTEQVAEGTSRVHFAPIVGAPIDKVTALSRRLSAAAPTNKIKLEPSASTTAEHEIRGYFSALTEDQTTSVIHVWDVFAPDGQRVHRIQGQEQIAAIDGANPWGAVPNSVMESIADKVLSQYAAWRASQ